MPTPATFELYDISNNTVTSTVAMGDVGLEWQVGGFGDFSSNSGETDMILRATRGPEAGALEVYDINHNAITSYAYMGIVGLEWTVAGFGDFSGNAGETDLLMRATSGPDAGDFEYYDISNNAITSAGLIAVTYATGTASQWTVAGFGDFSGNANETDMLLRNSTTGAFEVYDISNNKVTSSSAVGTVMFPWQVDGIAPASASAGSAASMGQLLQAAAGLASSDAALDQGSLTPAVADPTSPPNLLAATPQALPH